MATATVIPKTKIQGGSWLLEERSLDDIFTPEDFSEQHRLIAQTAEEFAQKEIVPNIEKMEHKDWGVVRELLRKASEIGIATVDVPAQYGGEEIANIDREKFTAFLVERTFPGFAVGAEEKKMGIRGSSTCPLILSDCQVPVENVLGEIGKGHVIAFNILNLGRFKLGAGCVGGARNSLTSAGSYSKQRKAFGKSIADFGLIKEKLANMAVGVYVGEAMIYRTVGMIEGALAEIQKEGRSAAEISHDIRKAIEEYAVECSIIKVWASEMLDRVVDDNVQIYGGYGFVEEYPAERAYRDSRVNRIFEGTNEINRMITTGWLLKQAMSGKLPLMAAIKKLMDEIMAGPSVAEPLEGALAAERTLVANAKKIALFTAGAASQKYMMALADQQEVMGTLADILIEVYAVESAVLRTQKMVTRDR